MYIDANDIIPDLNLDDIPLAPPVGDFPDDATNADIACWQAVNLMKANIVEGAPRILTDEEQQSLDNLILDTIRPRLLDLKVELAGVALDYPEMVRVAYLTFKEMVAIVLAQGLGPGPERPTA